MLTQQVFEAGPRAGIRVEFAGPALSLKLANQAGVFEVEFPALRVHDNIIVSHSGPALAALAAGPVSIADNELTAGELEVVSTASPWVIDRIRSVIGGSAVFVFDIGALSEFTNANVDYATIALHQNGLPGNVATDATLVEFMSGDILFNDNRVLLNCPDPDQSIVISSVALFGFADVSVEANQLTARTGNHPLTTNIIAVGVSVRLQNNRCQDRFDFGLSGMTLGFMNATVNNQGSRCFYATANPSLLVRTGNKSWVDLISKDLCSLLAGALNTHYSAAGYAIQE